MPQCSTSASWLFEAPLIGRPRNSNFRRLTLFGALQRLATSRFTTSEILRYFAMARPPRLEFPGGVYHVVVRVKKLGSVPCCAISLGQLELMRRQVLGPGGPVSGAAALVGNREDQDHFIFDDVNEWAAWSGDRITRSDKLECDRERSVQVPDLVACQAADVVGQDRFRQADQLIAVDCAFVLESLLGTDGNLCRETVARGVDGGASDGREGRVDQGRSADDDKDPRALRIALRMSDSVKLASLHQSA